MEDSNATIIEVHMASIQRESPKYASYQRSEKPGGGKVSARAEEKDIGITIRSGTVRKTRPKTPTAAKARRVQREPPIIPPLSRGCLAVEPAVTRKNQQRHDQQDGRDRRGLLPARDLVDQRVEQVGDHRHPPAAQDRRRYVEAKAEDEDQQGSRRQRRQGEWKIDLPEDRPRRRAQRGRRLQQPVVDAD